MYSTVSRFWLVHTRFFVKRHSNSTDIDRSFHWYIHPGTHQPLPSEFPEPKAVFILKMTVTSFSNQQISSHISLRHEKSDVIFFPQALPFDHPTSYMQLTVQQQHSIGNTGWNGSHSSTQLTEDWWSRKIRSDQPDGISDEGKYSKVQGNSCQGRPASP